MKINEEELKRIANQLEPQVKRENNKLRMKIAEQAMYNSNMPNDPYAIWYDGQGFISSDTGELVNQVIAWLKKPVEARAREILNRETS